MLSRITTFCILTGRVQGHTEEYHAVHRCAGRDELDGGSWGRGEMAEEGLNNPLKEKEYPGSTVGGNKIMTAEARIVTTNVFRELYWDYSGN